MKPLMFIMAIIIALSATTIGHAESNKDLDCLTSNIYYEAGNEPEEGKVAVGLVTINRSNDDRFPRGICEVVNQRMVKQIPSTVTSSRVEHDAIGRKKLITENRTVWKSVTICQFSWRCESFHRTHKINPTRWEESQRVARALLNGDYFDFRLKYSDAMYFHEYRVKPAWAKQKHRINKIGGHIFYADYRSADLTASIQ
jgi:spore germination cell wall hydrolase CwlJ-like protein